MIFDRTKVTLTLAVSLFVVGTTVAVLSGDDGPQAQAQEQEKESKAVAEASPEKGEAKAEGKPGDKAEGRAPASAESQEESSFGGAAAEPGAKSTLPPSSAVDELRRQRDAIDLKQKELASKELELKARERALDEELKKLKDTRDEISKIDDSRKKENEEKVAKFVETLETMSPKASSQLLGSIDESLSVAAIARMSTAKLAKIMNVMDPAKSSKLTELMAGVVRARNPAASAVAPRPESKSVAKGGEKQNAK
jgi:flagellar motility protein MotE (MotC chaperone)